MRGIIISVAVVVLTGCSAGGAVFEKVYYEPEFAERFEIVGVEGAQSRVVRVKAAWQGADSTAMDLFIARGGEVPPEGFKGQVIQNEAHRIVAMSSSYIAMLDLLEETDRTVAVSGIDFISSTYIQTHKDSIFDIGPEANADFEKVVAAAPDLVLLYGISASSPMQKRLQSLSIPYIYMGEYIEPSPLGRAEWLIAIGEIIGCRDRSKAVFQGIAERYLALKNRVADRIATAASARPKVMLNTPYGDTWYMASRATAMATMIADAGAEYVYKDNSSNKAMPIDMEKAFLLASEADFWLNTGRISSLSELISAYPKFAQVKCVASANVYNCDRRLTPGGGNDFWESGLVRPDIVLNDLVGIFNPGLASAGSEKDGLASAGFYYYRRLE